MMTNGEHSTGQIEKRVLDATFSDDQMVAIHKLLNERPPHASDQGYLLDRVTISIWIGPIWEDVGIEIEGEVHEFEDVSIRWEN